MPAHGEAALGPGQCDVGEPSFLEQLRIATARDELPVILGARLGSAIGERREVRGSIGMELPRHHRCARRPPLAATPAREDRLAHARDDDVREFQTLRAMGGHEHDGVTGGDLIASGRFVVALCLAQTCEEGAQP